MEQSANVNSNDSFFALGFSNIPEKEYSVAST
jgi:hypothetical protein